MAIFLNNDSVERFNFPGGECHIRITPSKVGENANIKAYLYNSDDIMSLLLTVDAIRRVNPIININLTMPYFPYARQDRICNKGEAFSVKVMVDLINSLQCNSVIIYDPHSDITPSLLNNCQVITSAKIITTSPLKSFIDDNLLTLVSPDAGAENKTKEIVKQLRKKEIINAFKTRDTKTGKITSCTINGNVKDKNIIIVDDICDGGQTFVELSKKLRSQGAKDIYLYVTHGIFSKGLKVLKEHLIHIYCYHTFLNENEIDNDFLTILEDK